MRAPQRNAEEGGFPLSHPAAMNQCPRDAGRREGLHSRRVIHATLPACMSAIQRMWLGTKLSM